jgi:hypothetical protein
MKGGLICLVKIRIDMGNDSLIMLSEVWDTIDELRALYDGMLMYDSLGDERHGGAMDALDAVVEFLSDRVK